MSIQPNNKKTSNESKHVVSVSLGRSEARDIYLQTTLLGQEVLLERRGVDGDMDKAKALIAELDGNVDAIGLGGIDLYAYIGDARYTIQDAQKLAQIAKKTPVVCGAGLKKYLEPRIIQALAEKYNLSGKRVLMTSAVDRYAMAAAFFEAGANVDIADLLFALNLPVVVRSLPQFRRLTQLVLPILFRLPFALLYPTGDKQSDSKQAQASKVDKPVSQRIAKFYHQADIIAGDWHYIRKYLPENLAAKIVVTNTTTTTDVELLKARGVATLITTTPRIEGRSLSTNMLEAALVACLGRHPLAPEDYAFLPALPTITELK